MKNFRPGLEGRDCDPDIVKVAAPLDEARDGIEFVASGLVDDVDETVIKVSPVVFVGSEVAGVVGSIEVGLVVISIELELVVVGIAGDSIADGELSTSHSERS
jgi:hypothetical protein